MLKKYFAKWKYFNLPSDEIKLIQPQIDTHNLNMLMIIGTVASVLLILTLVFPLFVERKFQKSIVSIVVALISILVTLFAFGLNRQRKYSDLQSHTAITAAILIFSLSILIFGIYIGVFSNKTMAASSFIGFIICVPLLFVVSPAQNLVTSMTCFTVFVVSTCLVKDHLVYRYDLVNGSSAVVVGAFVSWNVTRIKISDLISQHKMKDLANQMYRQSITDSLTNLPNRRHIMDTLNLYLKEAGEMSGLCSMIIDIDGFKGYNDFYGHPQGDDLLRKIGKLLAGYAKENAMEIGRFGGEEFFCLWKTDDYEECKKTAEGLINRIRDMKVHNSVSETGQFVTVSMGLFFKPATRSVSLIDIYSLTDKALYTAKRAGKNCIYAFDPESGEKIFIA